MEDEDQFSNTWVGTMNYMSPERIENDKGYSFEGDIWSLGLVVYELAIGQYPFKESTAFFDMVQ